MHIDLMISLVHQTISMGLNLDYIVFSFIDLSLIVATNMIDVTLGARNNLWEVDYGKRHHYPIYASPWYNIIFNFPSTY